MRDRRLIRVVSMHDGIKPNHYEEEWFNTHGHQVTFDGGHSRIETGAIEEFSVGEIVI